MIDSYQLKIVLILAVGFGFASVLGYFSQKVKLSPILGYLLAGYIIGPYSPGFVADLAISEQLAEIGVILMMFGVGLHFRWEDLVNVRRVAVPGAIAQTLIATLLAALLAYSLGWSLESGVIIGLAIGVASTVVLVRVLSDNHLLNTRQGHIAIGWLVVEDILTVMVLILLPTLETLLHGSSISGQAIANSIIFTLFKFAVLVFLMFTVGRTIIKFLMYKVVRTHSHELFTLALLALTFIIAVGASLIFGTSIALGAFIAGMVIGQTEVRHQAAANAQPLKDTFAVIFFLSVGMLFNPSAIWEHFPLFIGILAIVLIAKPFVAAVIVYMLRLPFEVALTVALSLAQIGEFSFILAEEALKLNIIPDEGYDVIVACAFISIPLNPILFRAISYIKRKFEGKTLAQRLHSLTKDIHTERRAIIVGHGAVGQGIARTLDKLNFVTVVVDKDIDKITALHEEQKQAIYGDANLPEVLASLHFERARLLAVAISDIDSTVDIIKHVYHINPRIKVLAYAVHTKDQERLKKLKISFVCLEEEALKAFNKALYRVSEWM